ncbi:Hachiman antiphage defense system protein HamA [Ancylobacter dichloromethanicus]
MAPRIFYKTASNDVVKSFDMVHIKYNTEDSF